MHISPLPCVYEHMQMLKLLDPRWCHLFAVMGLNIALRRVDVVH
jgi:hypothetical protein